MSTKSPDRSDQRSDDESSAERSAPKSPQGSVQRSDEETIVDKNPDNNCDCGDMEGAIEKLDFILRNDKSTKNIFPIGWDLVYVIK
jgi:hypothetical protein